MIENFYFGILYYVPAMFGTNKPYFGYHENIVLIFLKKILSTFDIKKFDESLNWGVCNKIVGTKVVI